MSKVVKLSVLGATSAVMCLAAPIGGSAALAGPVGLAAASSVAMPAATEVVHSRREGRSAHYCPPRRVVEHRTVYVRRIIERRTAYVPHYYGRSAYIAAPIATAVAVPVVATTYAYPAVGYGGYGGFGGGGLLGAGAGLLGGALNIGFGGGGWGGPGWGGGWGGGWGRRGWW
jgi:hypothetical protein